MGIGCTYISKLLSLLVSCELNGSAKAVKKNEEVYLDNTCGNMVIP
jgi:hypothetical protein